MRPAVGAQAGPRPEESPPMNPPGRSPLDPWIEAELATSERRMLLVDGFNVLHTVLLAGERDSIWWGRDAREKLLARVCAWPDARDEIWVAFDGSQPAWSVVAVPAARAAGGQGPMVHSVFVESADDWIVRRARRALPSSRAIVVSADRKVAGRARSAGCEVWSPWAFVAGCVAGCVDPASPAPLRRDRPEIAAAQAPEEPLAGPAEGVGAPLLLPSPNELS
jgi:hypothetical protein